MRKILGIYPKFETTYWGMQEALKFVGKKATHPPLGMLTVAGMLPEDFEIQLVDLNVRKLTEQDYEDAELILTGGMRVQRPSTKAIIADANQRGIPVLVGGPDVTLSRNPLFKDTAHVFRGEPETTCLEDVIEAAIRDSPRVFDFTGKYSSPDKSPMPQWKLINMQEYGSMALVMSKGCPVGCEFCDIPSLAGARTQYKSPERVIRELDVLFNLGWRGPIFYVDDNFVGNIASIRNILPAIVKWQQEHDMPFSFYSQATVNLVKKPDVIEQMINSGFDTIFLGLETVNEASIIETGKGSNRNINYLDAVRTFQRIGLEVYAGFILGFDNDDERSASRMFDFIQKAGIVSAMAGLLTVLEGSPLYARMEKEGRLQAAADSEGNNTHQFSFNFKARNADAHIEAYKWLLGELYGNPANYFERVRVLHEHRGTPKARNRLTPARLKAFVKALAIMPFSAYGREFGKFLVETVRCRKKHFADSVRQGIVGYHFHRLTVERLVKDYANRIEDAKQFLREKTYTGCEFARDQIESVLAPLKTALERFPKSVRQKARTFYNQLEIQIMASLQPISG